MDVRFPPAAVKKEFRALAPAWLGCLAIFAASAALMAPGRAQALRVVVYIIGAIALGALSMGHEYSSGTLSLLLSQPRRREHILLLKMGVLASLLLTLAGVEFALGVGGSYEQGLVLALPLLCGLFIAPWLTMLCRNPLAGMVFTVAAPGLVMLAGEIAAAVKFGMVGPTMAADANALKTAILWWGMLAVSALAAISGWRMFMRLEAIDGRGQALRLPWQRASASLSDTAPLFVKRHPVWLLIKKELRLQQLSFVVGGMYVLVWFGLWFGRSAIPHLDLSLAFAPVATALTILTLPLLAGSLASAEERQLGTLEWHALLPMRARTQWGMKVSVTVGVACLLGLALPIGLVFVAGPPQMRDGLPFLSAGVACAVIFLSVMGLYVSSLCASSAQALLWSVAAGFGLMTLADGWLRFNPLRWTSVWTEGDARMVLSWTAVAVLAVAMYAGTLGLLLGFASANHRSSERSLNRLLRQLLSLGTFLALAMSLSFGASRLFSAEASRQHQAYMASTYGYVTITVVDDRRVPVTDYTVVVFPEDRDPRTGRVQLPYRIESGIQYGFDPRLGTYLTLAGQYRMVAVEKMERGTGVLVNPELVARLKPRAIPLTIAAGDSKTLNLTLSTY